MIIGLSGKARSGKDTVAGIIREYEIEAIQYNLADPLKACVNDWLGWGYQHGYGDQKETPQALQPNFEALVGYIMKYFGAHASPEQAVKVVEQMREEFEAGRHRAVHNFAQNMFQEDRTRDDWFIISPRQVYQWFGTEGMRQHVDDDLWLKLIPDAGLVLLADVRFENEAQYVRDNGGVVVHITRPDCQEIVAHSSESGIVQQDKDYYLYNDGSIADLTCAVEDLLSEYLPE